MQKILDGRMNTVILLSELIDTRGSGKCSKIVVFLLCKGLFGFTVLYVGINKVNLGGAKAAKFLKEFYKKNF